MIDATPGEGFTPPPTCLESPPHDKQHGNHGQDKRRQDGTRDDKNQGTRDDKTGHEKTGYVKSMAQTRGANCNLELNLILTPS